MEETIGTVVSIRNSIRLHPTPSCLTSHWSRTPYMRHADCSLRSSPPAAFRASLSSGVRHLNNRSLHGMAPSDIIRLRNRPANIPNPNRVVLSGSFPKEPVILTLREKSGNSLRVESLDLLLITRCSHSSSHA